MCRVGTITLHGSQPGLQHVTTACHHCEDPGCLNGCPVKAYEKDPITGIVRHLDDQCIGCKYCTMMCPYEVPRYSDRLGIVRKCDMCHQRLSVGEAPACVQSCPNEAISIRIVDTSRQSVKETDRLAPGAPKSSITYPSTVYSGKRVSESLADATAQDAGVDEVAESHWPLVMMLVATQISVGMLLAERFASTMLWIDGSRMPIEATRWNASLALAIAAVGMSIAPLHLGRPLRAWRVFLGLRTSWLSREAVILGKYTAALAMAVALLWLPTYAEYIPAAITGRIPVWAAGAILVIATALGMLGLISSAMIYIATRRTLWRYQRTLIRFLGTAVAGGAAWTGVAMFIGHASNPITWFVLLGALILLVAKLDWEFQIHLGPSRSVDDDHDRRSRQLVDRHLVSIKQLRIAFGIAFIALLIGSLMAILLLPPGGALGITVLAAIMLTIGESCERLLYFRSVVYDRMPGTLR